MSRVANEPIVVPKSVEVTLKDGGIAVKGSKGVLEMMLKDQISVTHDEDGCLRVDFTSDSDKAMAGTTRALINNMVTGVEEGWEKTLILNGVGYRAKATGSSINLTLGFSHPVDYSLPEGVSAETPSQTEIVLKGVDKQKVGQAAANIRAFRPPEPYKGKGIRYSDEHVRRKEAKKK
tara:strand:+ start:367 stop:897 length:531 start_codon:yes stop_codon:yes gene_type:complete